MWDKTKLVNGNTNKPKGLSQKSNGSAPDGY
jgi:hypothetical protein